jgi:peptide/nickel transport system substrate-binding protein
MPPYAQASQTKLVIEQLFDRLAEPGDALNTIGDQGFLPRLATRWDWSADSLHITFHLDPRARWHDGVPVRARDVAFTWRLYKDPKAGLNNATQLSAIDSVTTPDSLTAVFWFRHRYPEQFFDATYQAYILPEHALSGVPASQLQNAPFAHQPIGDGQFRFASWTPGSTVELIADTANYRGRPNLDRVVVSITPNPGAALTRLLSGDADFYEAVPVASLGEVEKQPSLRTVVRSDPAYGFLWFNLRTGKPSHPHPIFGDPAVRRAIAMAIDRERVVRSVFDTFATVSNGPFARGTSSDDSSLTTLPFDTLAANRLLDSAGWKRGSDGIRVHNGRPLTFSLAVPTSSKFREQMAVLVQDQLTRIGARVAVEPVEIRLLMQRLSAHDFDATLQVWHTDGAMSDLRQTWSTVGIKDGANWGSYSDAAFDATLDSALETPVPSRAHGLLHRAYSILNADVPAVWLYQPRVIYGIHRRFQIAPMRTDAWWAHLGEWSVSPADRLPRDNIGLAAAPH